MGSESVVPLPVGRLIAGKYRLDRLIGKGGMGAVYAAHHELLDQPVAIKLLLGDGSTDAAAAARFLNEARAAARIPSDHVVRVLDVGMDGERPYFVMEYLDGEDLAQVLDARERLEEKEAVDDVLQAIEALAQAHALGIIHRDLKPSNLFRARRPDGSCIVKVLDFGIAKAFGAAAQATQHAAVTTQGLIGSPAYMAPEYVRSAKSIDTRADIWAIGVILYELLGGVVPFRGENPGEVLAAILETTPAPLASIRAGLSPGLVAVIMKCLARKPEDRYQELADVADALVPFASKPRASVANIRTTVTTLRLRPPRADASGATPRVGPDDETALAPIGPPGQQTNQSWTDAGLAAHVGPSRWAKVMGVAIGVGAVAGVVIAIGVVRTTSSASSRPIASASAAASAAASASAAAAAAAAAPAAASVSAPAVVAAPTPHRHPRPSPRPKPSEPSLARDRR